MNTANRYGAAWTTDGELVLTRREYGEAVNTPTAGVVWYPLPQVGPFFNYSESFPGISLGDPLLNTKTQPDAPLGRTREYGLYFKFFGGRLQGSLRRYDSISDGRIVNAPGLANVNASWNALGQTANVETGTPRDTQVLANTGYEFEVIANLTKSWRTSFNFAVPKSKQRDSFPEMKAYRVKYLAPWQAAAATNNTIATNLTALNPAIEAGNDGREQNTALKYRANLYSSYDFRSGRLRGFGCGGGANFYGDQIAGNVLNQPFNYIYRAGYTVATAHLSYTAPAGSSGVTGDYFAGYRFVDPRKFTLTTTFDF